MIKTVRLVMLVPVFVVFLAAPLGAQKTGKAPKSSTPAASAQTASPNQATTPQQPMDYLQASRIVNETVIEKWSGKVAVQVRGGRARGCIMNPDTGVPLCSTMDLKKLGRITVTEEQGGKGKHHYVSYRLLQDGRESSDIKSLPYMTVIGASFNWEAPTDPQAEAKAQAYADALNLLSAHARAEYEAEWQDFQQKAAAWRALPTKPAISDEVRMHRLVAEDALKQKQFDTAIDEYEAGLKIDPLWPEGHFNVALLYGELNDYEEATLHMRAYLDLRPGAHDAQAAHDQMLLWQGKLGQQ